MITHTEPNNMFKNVLMNEHHFENGNEVKFSNSHFVNQIFMKFKVWGEFELVGKLTSEGVYFIEKHLDTSSTEIKFVNYKKSLTKNLPIASQSAAETCEYHN